MQSLARVASAARSSMARPVAGAAVSIPARSSTLLSRSATTTAAPAGTEAGQHASPTLEKRVVEIDRLVRANTTWSLVLGGTYIIAFVTLSSIINAAAWTVKRELKHEIRQDIFDAEERIKEEIRLSRRR